VVWIESGPPQPTAFRPDPPQTGTDPAQSGSPPTQCALAQSSLQYHVSQHLAHGCVGTSASHPAQLAHTIWSGELIDGGVSLQYGGFSASDGEVPVISQPLNPTPTTHTCVDV
jgi:hypothetical protein